MASQESSALGAVTGGLHRPAARILAARSPGRLLLAELAG